MPVRQKERWHDNKNRKATGGGGNVPSNIKYIDFANIVHILK